MGLMDSLSDAATSASSAATKVITDTKAVVSSGISAVTTKIGEVSKLAQSGVTNLATSATSLAAGQIPGAAAAVGAASNAVSNLVNLGDISKFKSASVTTLNVSAKPPFPNILHNYSSYNYIFTLSVIPPESHNSPGDGYKAGDLGEIILKSASGRPNDRVETEYGKYDFFIEDLKMTGIVKSNREMGNTDHVDATFKVIEPYSMGLFFQAIDIASSKAGYKNYGDAPFLLTIEFIGHVNGDVQGVSADALKIEKTTRHFNLSISTIDMTVTGKGAVYNVTALASNNLAYTSTVANVKTEIAISGATIHEMLQTGDKSLQKVLNDTMIEAANRENRVADQILIYFPLDPTLNAPTGGGSDSATATTSSGGSVAAKLQLVQGNNKTLVQEETTMNAIGVCSMGFDFFRPADQPFGKDNTVYDREKKIYLRNNIPIIPNVGEMKFAMNTNIVKIINEVVLASDYPRQALGPEQVSDSGKVPWWKIETQVYFLSGDNIARTGIMPRLYVYRVVPYGMDGSPLLPPNADNTKTEGLRKQALKEYNYIYTSKNLDVINFNIHYDAGYFKEIGHDMGQNADSIDRARQQSNTPADQYQVPEIPSDGKEPNANNAPTRVIASATKTSTGTNGGTGIDTPAVIAARRAHDLFLNAADMVNLDLTILGDPYYLGDSGVGNYVAIPTNLENMNADAAINYQNGDVHVIVNFRTPLDIDASKGAYNFGPNKLVNKFSGVYTVVQVEHNFNRGKFTQILKLMRVQGQTGFGDGTYSSSAGLPLSIVPSKSKPESAPSTESSSAPSDLQGTEYI